MPNLRSSEPKSIRDKREAIFEEINDLDILVRRLKGVVQNEECLDDSSLADWQATATTLKNSVAIIELSLVALNDKIKQKEIK